jgi:hypothetical protein
VRRPIDHPAKNMLHYLFLTRENGGPWHIGGAEICAPVTSPMRPEPGPAHPLSQGADAVAAYFIPVVGVVARLGRGHGAEDESDRQGQRSLSQHNSVSPDC